MLPTSPAVASAPGRLSPEALPPQAWAGAIAGSPVPVLPAGPVLALAAHPDDETIGAGRLIHRLAADRPVIAAVATRGEGCYLGQGRHGIADVGAHRLAEWRRALGRLGATDAGCADLPDGGLADQAGLRAWVSGLLEASGAAVVLAPWRLDPHPDHAALGRAADEAVRLARTHGAAAALGREAAASEEVPVLVEYPVWATAWCEPQDAAAAGWSVQAWETGEADEQARERALACYPSQTTELVPGWGPVVPASALAHHGRQLVCLHQVERGRPVQP